MAGANDTLGVLYTRVWLTKQAKLNAEDSFFVSPRSLSEITQEDLEEMLSQYVQTIEAFQPLGLDNDDDENDMWADEDEALNTSGSSMSELSIFSQPRAALSSDSIVSPLSPEPLPSPFTTYLAEKPLPKSPLLDNTTATEETLISNEKPQGRRESLTSEEKQQKRRKSMTLEERAQIRRKSLTATLRIKNRLSWTSDTGVLPSSSIAQNMASELMTLFDMDFSVDIKLNTAPKLPELPFSRSDARKSQRLSTDSLSGLISTFEAFSIDDDPDFQAAQTKKRLSQNRPRQTTFPPPPVMPPPQSQTTEQRSSSLSALVVETPKPITTNRFIPAPPKRSSSLKYREERIYEENRGGGSSKSTERLNSLSNALGHSSDTESTKPAGLEHKLTKSKSLRRLASFVKKNKSNKDVSRNDSTASPYLALPQQQSQTVSQQSLQRTSFSSNASSSSWSSTSEVLVAHKTVAHSTNRQGDPSVAKRRSLTVARPVVIEAEELRRARSLGHRYLANRKKRRSSLMETTASKRRSLREKQQQQPESAAKESKGLSRSKSAFIRIGNGLRSRKQTRREKELRRRSTTKRISLARELDNITDGKQQQASTFVKRMTSLGRRMRLQRI